jgi:predicted nucleic acid-binding protein
VKDGHERNALAAVFDGAFDVAPLDHEIAQRGGLMRRDFGRRYGTGLADALIAATAERLQATLATRNRKHLPMLERVHSPYDE